MWVVYRLRSTREGRKREEFPAGTLDWGEGGLHLDIPDRTLSRSIKSLFGEVFRVRAVRGGPETFLGHSWLQLEPGSEQHFDEALRRLVRLNLVVEETP